MLLENQDLYDDFIRVNIDVDPNTHQRPKLFYDIQGMLNFKIVEVPTIIVNNAEYILTGEQAFSWLNDAIQPQKTQQTPVEVAGFNRNEMGSFSDSYASFGNIDLHSNTADQTFAFVDRPFEPIPTPAEEGKISENDYSEKQMEREKFDNIAKKSNSSSNYNDQQRINDNKGGSANQFNSKNFNGKVSHKQKEMDSKFQQMMQDREQLNLSRSRVG